MLFGNLKAAVEALPHHLLTCSEFELCDEVEPGPSDYKMRQNFSDAVAVAREKGKQIRLSSVYEDVVSRQTFFDWYLVNPKKIAFITRPVVPHHHYYDAIFKEGLRAMFKYVRTYDFDPKTIATFAKIVEKAGDRTIGPVAQRIQMHQKQEVTHNSGTSTVDVTPDDPVAIRAKIQELTERMNQTKAIDLIAKPVIDAD